MSQIKISLAIYGLENLFDGDMTKVVEVVKMADDLGYDKMTMTDHVIMGNRTDLYPYGQFPSPPETPWYEPLVTLSVIAGSTSHIRLSTSVLIAPLRPPVLLAKMLATLDQLSKGRVDLGVGVGWQKEEYEALGVPFSGRGERLENQLRACKALWEESPASFESSTVSFSNIYCQPSPYNKGGIPVWFGLAPTPVNCRRIAELGVGWLPMVSDPKAIAEGVSSIREAFREAGRNPDELQVTSSLGFGDKGAPTSETFHRFEQIVEAGVTHVQVSPVSMAASEKDIRLCLENMLAIKKV